MRWPRASCSWVARSRSEPNWAKAASSRYWARSRRSLPAICRIALIWADPPTRETEMPALTASRRPAEQQRELPVRGRVLGEVVVDAESVAAGVTEVLAHRAARVGRDVLERRRLGGGGDHDGGVGHRPGVLQHIRSEERRVGKECRSRWSPYH